MPDGCYLFGNSYVISPTSRAQFCKILVQAVLDEHT